MKKFGGLPSFFVVCLLTSAMAATVPSGTNLAYGITPAVDCNYGSAASADQYFPQGATDGVRCCEDAYKTTWASCHASVIHFCNVGFSSPKTVGSVALFWKWNGTRDNYMAPQEINVSVFTGGEWVHKVVEYPFQGDDLLYADSLTVIGWDPAVSVDSVKVWMNPDMGYLTYSNLLWIGEFEIYAATGTGMAPPPPPAIMNVASSATHGFAVTTKQQKSGMLFTMALPQTADYSLSIFDVAGKKLWMRGISANSAALSQQVVWDRGNAPSGIYLAVLNQKGMQYMHRFMLR